MLELDTDIVETVDTSVDIDEMDTDLDVTIDTELVETSIVIVNQIELVAAEW